jgi:hypothetical protein
MGGESVSDATSGGAGAGRPGEPEGVRGASAPPGREWRGWSDWDLIGISGVTALISIAVTAILTSTVLAPPAAPEATRPGGAAAVPSAASPGTPGGAPPEAAPEGPAVAGDGSWPPPRPGAREVAVKKADDLVVRRVPRIATDNPHWEAWRDCAYVDVFVTAQQMAMPTATDASVEKLRVQGMTDGRTIAWRVSWADATPDGNVDVGRFCDAVAIGFPLDEGAPPMMGSKDRRVQILYWKALWQKDIDVGFQDVQDLHPNFWSDIYWFAEGQFPYPVPAAFQHPAARQWFIAHQAGNPMAAFSRTQPVEELVAEGWSTLTHQPHAATTGRGAWVDGTWAVVFQRPLKTVDPLDYGFALGASGQVVCAVWNGSAGNRGGRKQWSNWTLFEVER